MKHNILTIAFLSLLFFCCDAQKKSIVITNPVLDMDFPDPTVINVHGKYFAYATNGSYNGKTLNIRIASSTDLQHWKIEGDALPQKPSWASTTQDFWAPDVIYDQSLNKYVMFYSGKSDDTTTDKCLGVAFADKPEGPFVDKGSPLICGKSFINIDPKALIDPKSGKKLLYWGSAFEPIKVQEMENDWQHFKTGSSPQPMVWPGKEKEYTHLIEGGWVDYANGYYYLYYSGDNCCGNKANYAVLVARSKNAFGPFETLGTNNGTNKSVILEKDDVWLAPGHNSIFRDNNGQTWIAYHAIKKATVNPGPEGNHYYGREMCLKKIVYKNGWPVLVEN